MQKNRIACDSLLRPAADALLSQQLLTPLEAADIVRYAFWVSTPTLSRRGSFFRAVVVVVAWSSSRPRRRAQTTRRSLARARNVWSLAARTHLSPSLYPHLSVPSSPQLSPPRAL